MKRDYRGLPSNLKIYRKSPWRITFQWENAEMKNVELVRIEAPHRSPPQMTLQPTAIPRDPHKVPKPLSNPAAALIRDTIAHHGVTQLAAAAAMNLSKAHPVVPDQGLGCAPGVGDDKLATDSPATAAPRSISTLSARVTLATRRSSLAWTLSSVHGG